MNVYKHILRDRQTDRDQETDRVTLDEGTNDQQSSIKAKKTFFFFLKIFIKSKKLGSATVIYCTGKLQNNQTAHFPSLLASN